MRTLERNVPIEIVKNADAIEASGRLANLKDAWNIAHYLSVGGFSMICVALRKLGWKGCCYNKACYKSRICWYEQKQ